MFARPAEWGRLNGATKSDAGTRSLGRSAASDTPTLPHFARVVNDSKILQKKSLQSAPGH